MRIGLGSYWPAFIAEEELQDISADLAGSRVKSVLSMMLTAAKDLTANGNAQLTLLKTTRWEIFVVTANTSFIWISQDL